jgi:Protein of unknown function (DUF3303)
MLFALKYRPKASRTAAEAQRVRELLMAWESPETVEIRHHFHYASGGGVVIVESQVPSALFEAMEPFKPMVEFDVEPVVNLVEALAISLDVNEWAASVKDGPKM